MNLHSTTKPETIAMVTAARIERGLPAMITELYEAARAHERGQQLPPSTPGMSMLLDYLKQRYDAETERAWRAQYASYPPDAPAALGDAPRIAVPDWLRDLSEPQLLADEVPSYLLSQPPIAHGIAPLPPLGGSEARE